MYNSIKIYDKFAFFLIALLGTQSGNLVADQEITVRNRYETKFNQSGFQGWRTFPLKQVATTRIETKTDACCCWSGRIQLFKTSDSFIFTICLNFRGEWPGTVTTIVLRLQQCLFDKRGHVWFLGVGWSFHQESAKCLWAEEFKTGLSPQEKPS